MKKQLDLSPFRINVHSQNGEDLVIEKLLEIMNISSGCLVEFGAYDGPYLSNTWYHLSKNPKFSTIQIEENPERFGLLEKNIQNLPGICYTIIPGKVEIDGPNCLNAIFDDVKAQDNGVDVDNIAVLSIDVDGDDLDIWGSLDITRYRPAIVIIEASKWQSDQSVNELNDIFSRKGYNLVHVTGNFIFVDSKYGISAVLNIHQLCRASGNPEFMAFYGQISEEEKLNYFAQLPGIDIHTRLAGEQIIEF